MRALRPTLLYLVIAGFWVIFSDLLLSRFGLDTGAYEYLSLLKGLGFVLMSGLVLFAALRINERRWLATEKTLRAHVSTLRQAAAVFDATPEGTA